MITCPPPSLSEGIRLVCLYPVCKKAHQIVIASIRGHMLIDVQNDGKPVRGFPI